MDTEYKGTKRKLVIAFDLGTTESGASFCILEPRKIPVKWNVERFPGREYAMSSNKIPTIMYYDKLGRMVAAGAEVLSEQNIEKAQEHGWVRVEWFKLRLRPDLLDWDFSDDSLTDLPAGKNVDDMYGDFYEYLMLCTKQYIKEAYPVYGRSWTELCTEAEFILTHPNGWAGPQQTRMRHAAVLGGLIPDSTEGRARIHFVTEGEASLHYCIEERHLDYNSTHSFVVADLGGGTLDFSSYKVTAISPLHVVEMSAAKCSEMVTKRLRKYAQERLLGSNYGKKEYIDDFERIFNETQKRIFSSRSTDISIRFEGLQARDVKFGIAGGKFKVSGTDVASFFDPSITAAESAVREYIEDAKVKISAVYLVGGFSRSEFVGSELKRRLSDVLASDMIRAPGSDASVKAAALGGLCYFIGRFVKARIARASYGHICHSNFDINDKEHVRRKGIKFTEWTSGRITLPGKFDTILEKGTEVDEETQFRLPFFLEINPSAEGKDLLFIEEIWIYTGPGKTIGWEDEVRNRKYLRQLCTVNADLSSLKRLTSIRRAPSSSTFLYFEYEIVLWFGGPEIKAQICWRENDKETWGPVTIIYDDDCGGDIS